MSPIERGDSPEPESAEPREGVFDAQLSFSAPFVEAPEPIQAIIKRDGTQVPFDRRKIAEAIFQAAAAIGGDDRDRAESLASGVAIYLAKKTQGGVPTAQEVQDAVEKVLIEMGHARTALTFARYRDKRERIRRLRRGDMRSLLNELQEARRGAAEPEAASSLFVRTSDERLAGWDRARIVEALIRETGMAKDLAEVVAVEVEGQIVAAGVQTLTAPLIRELVDAKLVERGLEEYRRKHMRLGVPLYDAERIICAPNQGESEQIADPASTDVALAQRVKREYAITRVFSQEVADAHLSGRLHLHGLGFIDRLHSCRQSLAYLQRFGVAFPGTRRFARPPVRPEILLAQLSQFTGSLRSHFAKAIGWDALNVFLAPFLSGMDAEEMRPLARLLVFGLTQGAGASHRQSPAIDLELCWTVPGWLRELRALGPGGEQAKETYGAFEHTAQQMAWALLEAWKEGDADEPLYMGVTPSVSISTDFFSAPGHGAWLGHAAEEIAGRGQTRFLFERGPNQRPDPAPAWAPVEMTLHQVTLNLPRAALAARDEAGLFDALAELVGLAAQAHDEKRLCIERLLAFKDVGPLSLLAAEHEGRRFLDVERASCRVGLVGLNECVQAMTGAQLHESDEAMALGGRIAAHLAALCNAHGREEGLRLVPGQCDGDTATRRFATHDVHEFGERASALLKADPVTQDVCYTGGTCLAEDADLSPIERVRLEGRFHGAVPANAITRVHLGDLDTSAESISDFVQKVFYRTDCRCLVFTRQ
ncbi:MAG: anaerobic ribonucleoside-triphosphate reductase [Candidatus Hydrogenedentes bacterium]|nr:anaerobic ribonucleoside-triphosphate reductase [Candidatus Hydrogenedentota bacterium]